MAEDQEQDPQNEVPVNQSVEGTDPIFGMLTDRTSQAKLAYEQVKQPSVIPGA